MDFRTDIKNRGVEKYPATYAYRDDGMKLYELLFNYVGEYLAVYYKDDAAVQSDRLVQHWNLECQSMWPVNATLGKPRIPLARSVKALQYILTNIIFQASAKHAAVNFAQYEENAYVPARPNMLMLNPDQLRTEVVDEASFVSKLMPPQLQATLGLAIYRVLSGYSDEEQYLWHPKDQSQRHWNERFADGGDKGGRPVHERLYANMEKLQAELEAQDAGRVTRGLKSYVRFQPKMVPNSIAI